MGDDAINVESENNELLLQFLGAGESFKLIDATNLSDILDETANKWDMFTSDTDIESHSNSAVRNINTNSNTNTSTSTTNTTNTNANTNTPGRGKKQAPVEENIALKFIRDKVNGNNEHNEEEEEDVLSTNLREKTSFTFSLLERLCNIVMMRDMRDGQGSYGVQGDGTDVSDLLSSIPEGEYDKNDNNDTNGITNTSITY